MSAPASRRWAALGCLLTVAACTTSAGGDPESSPDPTAPPTEAVAPEATDAGTASTSTAPAPDEPDVTTSLVASAGADLPTGTPEELSTIPPHTTPAGPLPVPSVELVEFATFEAPVEVTSRDLDPRTIVVDQVGRVHAADDLSSEVIADITELTSASGEQGLFGVAFHPDQDLAYLHYTGSDGNTVLDEYAIDPVTAVFDAESRREVLTVTQPFGNHNGGEITFGPDGYLYLGLGDGGAADDPNRVALDLSSPLGKILRIDPRESGDDPYAVPADNPFVGAADADPRIWSYGLRNPWRFSFDSATGDLWIADVGQGDVEEIDVARAVNQQGAGRGLSFGWSAFEGDVRFNADQPAEGHEPPLLTYLHDNGNCSVSGGAVYRGALVPDLVGWYLYGDFCTGLIWGYDTTSGADNPVIFELGVMPSLAAIAVGGEGELFAVSNTGLVARFAAA